MEDLDAATLEDVKEWFRTYYGAANAVLVVAGDVKPGRREGEGREVLRRHPAGPPTARQEAWVAKRTGSQRGRDVGPRAAGADLQGLEHAAAGARRTATTST